MGWRCIGYLDEFTGIGYFFGRMIRESFGVPVGLLNITLGGSPIESWMDEETLAAWPRMLTDLAPYRMMMKPVCAMSLALRPAPGGMKICVCEKSTDGMRMRKPEP